MLHSAGDANGEAETHGGGDDEVGEDLHGMLNGIEHVDTLTQNEEDDRLRCDSLTPSLATGRLHDAARLVNNALRLMRGEEILPKSCTSPVRHHLFADASTLNCDPA